MDKDFYQTIEVVKVGDFGGESHSIVSRFDGNYADIENYLHTHSIELNPKKYPLMHTIDPYGETLFPHNKFKQVAKEFEELKGLIKDDRVVETLDRLLLYVNSCELNESIIFFGD